MLKIISVVGARPNFMKVAPLHKVFKKHPAEVQHLICHTGQHFDANMSKVFFEELELPKPDFYLGISGGSHASQTAAIMVEFEKVLLKEKPGLVIVVGDVNSTLACSVVASKLGIKVAHVEAGLRSFDRTMPEEINRMVTDVLADYLFVTEKSGLEHLKHEGIADSKVFFTGNVMIDSLFQYLPKVDSSDILKTVNAEKGNYILVTFHRPANVDTRPYLLELIEFLNGLAEKKKIIFPLHPRTRSNMEKFGLTGKIHGNVLLTQPIGYIEFVGLEKNAELVVTDSGGIQEETTALGVQCITVRDNTERPITVELGTNQLAGTNLAHVKRLALDTLGGKTKKGSIPPLWDGHAAERIGDIILKLFNA